MGTLITCIELYNEIEKAGIEIQNYRSDLYIPINEETKELIAKYEQRIQVTTFINQIDKKLWYEIPFAYLPYWQKRGML